MKNYNNQPTVNDVVNVPALTGSIDILRQRIDTALNTSREIALKLNQFDGHFNPAEASFPAMPGNSCDVTVIEKLSYMNDLISMVNDELASTMQRLGNLV